MKISIALGMWLICAEGLAGSAHAYCRRSSCDSKPARVCVPATPEDCGTPARWADKLIAYDVAATAPGTIDYAAAIQRGFAAWTAADCGDGRHPSLAIVPHVVPTPDTTPARGRVLVGDQPADPRQGTLALTTLRFSQRNGAMISARTTFFNTQLEGHGEGAFVDSLALHEAGHFLGLAHSDDAASVMSAEVHDGAQQRQALAADDVAAVCAAFPPVGGPGADRSPMVIGGLVAGLVAAIGGAGLWWLKRRPSKLARRGRR